MAGYTADKEQVTARLRRIEGQIGGLEKMVEDDRYCIDVSTQVNAARFPGPLTGTSHLLVVGATTSAL
jgi:DNA-binding FrmR family transcriptional regulator